MCTIYVTSFFIINYYYWLIKKNVCVVQAIELNEELNKTYYFFKDHIYLFIFSEEYNKIHQ